MIKGVVVIKWKGGHSVFQDQRERSVYGQTKQKIYILSVGLPILHLKIKWENYPT